MYNSITSTNTSTGKLHVGQVCWRYKLKVTLVEK